MAYQNVGQCRFFIDHALWFKATGDEDFLSSPGTLGTLNPAMQHYDLGNISFTLINNPPVNYVAYLGHD